LLDSANAPLTLPEFSHESRSSPIKFPPPASGVDTCTYHSAEFWSDRLPTLRDDGSFLFVMRLRLLPLTYVLVRCPSSFRPWYLDPASSSSVLDVSFLFPCGTLLDQYDCFSLTATPGSCLRPLFFPFFLRDDEWSVPTFWSVFIDRTHSRFFLCLFSRRTYDRQSLFCFFSLVHCRGDFTAPPFLTLCY